MFAAEKSIRSNCRKSGLLFLAYTALASTEEPRTIDEVVVTAQRREESSGRVPITVTAFNEDQLTRRTMISVNDLQQAVPGLTVRTTGNSPVPSFSIRGQSMEFSSGSVPAVLHYVNDVEIQPGGSQLIYDLAAVQVLKGPQGTLFGRNTTGGAVLYNTAIPSDDFEASAAVRFGNYSYRQVEGVLNAPIVKDRVKLRLAGSFSERDGYVRNLFNNQDLGSADRNSIRGSLLLELTDRLENITVVQDDRQRGSASATGSIYALNRCGSPGLVSTVACLYTPAGFEGTFGPGAWNAFLGAHPNVPPEGIESFADTQRARGPFVVNEDEPGKSEIDNLLITNTTTYSINENITLKNIFGYSKFEALARTDPDGSPYPVLLDYQVSTGLDGYRDTNKQYSEELQISGSTDDDRIQYVAGVFYNDNTHTTKGYVSLLDMLPFAAPIDITPSFRYETKSTAAYGQINYDLSGLTGVDGLSAFAGMRYTWEKYHLRITPGGITFPIYGASPQDLKVDKPSWTVGLNYQVSSDLMLYATSRGSWRSGAINGYAPTQPGTAKVGGNEIPPETTIDVEVGTKYRGHLGGMSFSANVAIYNQWVRDVQRLNPTLVDGVLKALTASVPEARIRGVEVDAVLRPTEWLELGGYVAYTDAEYTSPSVNLFGNMYVFGPYADTPEWAGTAYFQAGFFVPQLGEMFVRGSVYAQSVQYFSNTHATVTPETDLSGYATVNLRVGINGIRGSGTSIALFAKNLLDKTHYVDGLSIGSSLGVSTANPGEPRTYGVELSYRF